MAVAPQQSLFARLREFNRLSGGQKIGLMLALAAAIALVSGAWMWSQTPDYRVLYSNLCAAGIFDPVVADSILELAG